MVDRARALALQVLLEVEAKGCFVEGALTRCAPPAPNERARILNLVKGTLRWRGRIDYLLGALSKRPLSSLSNPILNILRLGAYEILLCPEVPAWAAVNEAVELARARGHEGHVRFVNGVLRNLVRHGEWVPLPEASNVVTHLSVAHAFPEWLVTRWCRRFGEVEAAQLMQACNQPADLCLRVNTLKISPRQCLEAVRGAVAAVRAHPWIPEALVVRGAGPVSELPGYAEGWHYVQDVGAMLVTYLLGVLPGERVLDACAAPGGKSTHLAQKMGDQGEVVALEADRSRLDRIGENTRRLGIRSVRTQLGDATRSRFSEPFDRVLIDAPCSGLGTLRRHPEGKWQKKEADLVRHQERQLAILQNISPAVKEGGVMVYATCSTEPEENETVIQKFLRGAPVFTVEKEPKDLLPEMRGMIDAGGFLHAYPHRHDSDGFFAARLVKRPTGCRGADRCERRLKNT